MKMRRKVYRIMISCTAFMVCIRLFSISAPTREWAAGAPPDYQHPTTTTSTTTTTAKTSNTTSQGYSVYHKSDFISKSQVHAGSYWSSEMEPTSWTTLFFPIRNICYTNGKLHFFQSDKDPTQSGVKAHKFFQENREPWRVFLSWEGDAQNWGSWDPEPTLHNMSMEEWMAQTSEERKINLYHGTSFVVPPHLPHNMFHTFNDLIIPTFRDALLSGSVPQEDDLSDPKAFRNLFLLGGNKAFIDNRVIMFDTLFKLFHRVHYPFEAFITQANEKAAVTGRAVCFDRYIWTQRRKNTHHPFYSHFGRFDEDNNNQWEGIVPALRDAINKAYDIKVPPKNAHLNELRMGKKPKLVWASRTHNQAIFCDRCIVNEAELLAALEEKFEVELLPINNRKQSREKNVDKALQLMATADMFGGLHGAGLGHALLLQPGSAVFEMRDRSHWQSNLFLNMANLNNVGYYAYDARPLEEAGEKQRFVLKREDVDTIVDGLWKAWSGELKERLKKALKPPSPSQQTLVDDSQQGTCKSLFPLTNLSGRVSTFDSSRCYLSRIGSRWRQQSDFSEGA